MIGEFTLFDFASEDIAKAYLEELLRPHFVLRREIECKHLIAGNRLRIDYVGRPKEDIDFPFDWFGIEIKRSCRGGDYNRAIKQAVDYTFCEIDDDQVARIKGRRIERVYLFPGLPDHVGQAIGPAFWVNRLAGLFHVGMIYVRRYWGRDETYFVTSADRQWSSDRGAITRKHNVRQRVGSGVLRVIK
jgi:hypothetical protein